MARDHHVVLAIPHPRLQHVCDGPVDRHSDPGLPLRLGQGQGDVLGLAVVDPTGQVGVQADGQGGSGGGGAT